MKPAAFDYVRPPDLPTALAALAAAGDEAMPVAGGQSLLPLLGLRMSRARLLVDIGRLDELRQVQEAADHVVIGAAVTHAEIEDGRIPDPGRGLMRRMARRIAYRAVRNQGTIGGSVAMADPAADWPVCLIALGAKARIAGAGGARIVPVSGLIEDVYTTGLAPGELITGFDIPRLGAAARCGVSKVARKTGAFAMSLAVAIIDGETKDSRVVLAGASGKAQRLAATSEKLCAGEFSEGLLRAAIAHDLSSLNGECDAYAVRLHTAVALRAIAEATAP